MKGKYDNVRQAKIASEVQKILSEHLASNLINDSEGVDSSVISITRVEISACLQRAKIYIVSTFADLSNEEAIKFLKRHVADIKSLLGQKLRLKFTPNLTFIIDKSYNDTERVYSLLRRLAESREQSLIK
jgi:ribosome-binding factor A